MNPNELPPDIRRAFDQYPQIEPSPSFNRAVLQSLEAAHAARRLTLVGRIEEFLGLKWWQFAASGMLGALLPAVILGALFLSNRGVAPAKQTPIDPFMPRSIGPLYARELWRQDLREAPETAPAPEVAPAPAVQGDELSCVESKFPLV